MNRLYVGGSFNPIHHGHLLIARAVAEASGYDRVVLVPNACPPHKPWAAGLAPATDRLALCHLAVESSDLFELNDLELHRSGPSYTIDTVRQLTSLGAGPVNWLIGGDTVPLLPLWHEAPALLRETNFVIAARPDCSIDWGRLPTSMQHLRNNIVPVPLIQISSTDIRHRLATGKSVDYLMPPAVIRYISQHCLYQRPEGGPARAGQ